MVTSYWRSTASENKISKLRVYILDEEHDQGSPLLKGFTFSFPHLWEFKPENCHLELSNGLNYKMDL